MPLPLKAIDRLFDRLTLTYGRAFMGQWDGIPERQLGDLKSLWADELGQFAGRLECVAWALENLPDRAPNVIEFKALCRKAPRPAVAALPEPPADPQRLATELAKLSDVRRAVASGGASRTDPKGWAHAILARVAAGERVSPAVRTMARQALGREALEAA